jgi:hypothetical protein
VKRIAFVFAAALALTLPTFAAEQFTHQQLASLVASAKTSAEHLRMANYYRAQADRLLAESNDHARMGAAFRSNPATNNAKRANGTVNHCEYLAQTLKAKSEGVRALAEEHERMAKGAELK